MKKFYILLSVSLIAASCAEKLPEIAPDVVTQPTKYDTDDPAIWVNSDDSAMSIVFGTDKETDGAIYAFDLDGKIIEDKTIRNLKRPNNIDLEYGFNLNDSTQVDIIAFTERERQQFRVFSVPDMIPLDAGGFKVFEDASVPESNWPMGIAVYKSPSSNEVHIVVGRKTGPNINYLHQYQLISDSLGVRAEKVREFGAFSGKAEIEAIAIDDELGHVYYADEGHCIRKYHAEPSKGNAELACFGGERFKEDIEGIAIANFGDEGYLIVSNQQAGTFNIFNKKTHDFIKEINLGTTETDGCDLTTSPLGGKFPNGLFVSMNNDKTFFYHDLGRLGLKD